jgi:hypothetical protein
MAAVCTRCLAKKAIYDRHPQVQCIDRERNAHSVVIALMPRKQDIGISEFRKIDHAHRVDDSARRSLPGLVEWPRLARIPAALPALYLSVDFSNSASNLRTQYSLVPSLVISPIILIYNDIFHLSSVNIPWRTVLLSVNIAATKLHARFEV